MNILRTLILPFGAVAIALNIAGCAVSMGVQGNYRGVVDPSRMEKLQGRQPRALLNEMGFTRDNPYPRYR